MIALEKGVVLGNVQHAQSRSAFKGQCQAIDYPARNRFWNLWHRHTHRLSPQKSQIAIHGFRRGTNSQPIQLIGTFNRHVSGMDFARRMGKYSDRIDTLKGSLHMRCRKLMGRHAGGFARSRQEGLIECLGFREAIRRIAEQGPGNIHHPVLCLIIERGC